MIDGGGERVVALEARLRRCRNVETLGVRPNFSDYSEAHRRRIRRAEKIYYPSTFYADIFQSIGKAIFPSIQTYLFAQDKIRQTALFQVLGIPHPRTRVFYGPRQQTGILDRFPFPFVAKMPRGSSLGQGVFLIRTPDDLDRYLQRTRVAYIQEYLPMKRDLRVVVIGKDVVHAYWRVARDGEFRCNIHQGGRVQLDPVPEPALQLARRIAASAGWNDVGIDICEYRSQFYVVEANMKYGREGFLAAGIDYHLMMERMIRHGEI